MLSVVFFLTAALCASADAKFAKQASPELAVPRRVLELPSSKDVPRTGEGDTIRLKNGDYLHVYSHFTAGDGTDFTPGEIRSRVSHDGGLTWSTNSVLVAKREAKVNEMSVSLLRLRSGDLALFYLKKNSELDCCPVMRISKDEAKTWGPARSILGGADVSYYVVNNCRAEMLSTGRIVVPYVMHPTLVRADGRKPGMDYGGYAGAFYSNDDGKTWCRGAGILVGNYFDETGKLRRTTFQEPGVFELTDGRLGMYLRTFDGCQFISYSSDGGETWCRAVPWTLNSPLASATVKRLRNGDLVAIWNDHAGHPELKMQRAPLVMATSSDDGRTWRNRKVLEGYLKGWFSYISCYETHDDALLLSYWTHGSRVTRVPLEWLYGPDPFPEDPTTTKGFFMHPGWECDDAEPEMSPARIRQMSLGSNITNETTKGENE